MPECSAEFRLVRDCMESQLKFLALCIFLAKIYSNLLAKADVYSISGLSLALIRHLYGICLFQGRRNVESATGGEGSFITAGLYDGRGDNIDVPAQ